MEMATTLHGTAHDIMRMGCLGFFSVYGIFCLLVCLVFGSSSSGGGESGSNETRRIRNSHVMMLTLNNRYKLAHNYTKHARKMSGCFRG